MADDYFDRMDDMTDKRHGTYSIGSSASAHGVSAQQPAMNNLQNTTEVLEGAYYSAPTGNDDVAAPSETEQKASDQPEQESSTELEKSTKAKVKETPYSAADEIEKSKSFMQSTNARAAEIENAYDENADRYKVRLRQDQYDVLNKYIAGSTDDPKQAEQNAYDLATAYQYSNQFGVPLNTAVQNKDWYNYLIFGSEKVNPDHKAWYKAVVDSFTSGRNTMKMADLGTKIMDAEMDGDTDLAKSYMAEYSQYEKENLSLQDDTPRSWAVQALKFGANSLPFTASAATAGVVGSLIPGLGLLASFGVSYKQTQGLEYVTLRQQGASAVTANNVSTFSGGLQAVVEVALGDTMAAAGGVLKAAGKSVVGENARAALVSKITDNLFRRMHYGRTFQTIANSFARYAGENLEEGLEEAVQEAISLTGQKIASSLDDYGIEHKSAGGIAKDLAEQFAGGFAGSLVLGLPVAGLNLKAGVSDYTSLRSKAEVIDSEEEFKKEAGGSPVLEGMDKGRKQDVLHEIYRNAKDARDRKDAAAVADVAESVDVKPGAESAPVDENGERLKAGAEYRNKDGSLGTEFDVDALKDGKDGSQGGRFMVGDPTRAHSLEEGGNRYGYIDYEVRGDNVKIKAFKMAPGRSAIAEEFYSDFAEQFAGSKIEWDPNERTNIELKKSIIEHNPNGKSAGLGYFADESTVSDNRARMRISRELTETGGNFTAETKAAVVALFEARANKLGKGLADFVTETYGDSIFTSEKTGEINQAERSGEGVFGATGFMRDGKGTGVTQMVRDAKAVTYVSEHGDFNTAAHEFAHVVLHYMTDGEMREAEKAFKIEGGSWTVAKQEEFADGFVDYLRTGKAPSEGLMKLFEQCAKFVAGIFRGLQGHVELSDDVKNVYGSLLKDDGTGLSKAMRAVDEQQRKSNLESLYETESVAAEQDAEKVQAENSPNAQKKAENSPNAQKKADSVKAREAKASKDVDGVVESPSTTTTAEQKQNAVYNFAGQRYASMLQDNNGLKSRWSTGPDGENLLDGKPAMLFQSANAEEKIEERSQIDDVRKLYEGTAQWMKAPNGKETNLTERQWMQVRTPNFKKWFGDWEKIWNKRKLENNIVAETSTQTIKPDESGSIISGAVDWIAQNIKEPVSTVIGKVVVNGNGIKDSLSHKFGKDKIAAITAIKPVLEDGVYIGSEKDFDGKPIVNHYFAGKVKIDGDDKYVFCRVRESLQGQNDKRFYVHEVFVEDEIKSGLPHKTGPSINGRVTGSGKPLYLNILQNYSAVNENDVSTAVDENGEPKKFYHGSSAMKPFDVFNYRHFGQNDYGWLGVGHYFSGDADVAYNYITGNQPLFEVFLNARNSYNMSDEEHEDMANNGDIEKSENFTQEIKDEGYDSVWFNGDLNQELVVFDSRQIKSATGNSGEFSAENPSILFQTDKALLESAANFPTWQEFMAFYEGELAPRDKAVPAGADEAWYKAAYEKAVKLEQSNIHNDENAVRGTDGGVPASEDARDAEWYANMQKPGALDEFLKGIQHAMFSKDWQPSDEEDMMDMQEQQRKRERVRSELKHGFWVSGAQAARRDMDKESVGITQRARKTLMTLMRRSKRDYRDIWADVMDQKDWRVSEDETTSAQIAARINSPDTDAAKAYTPEERRAMAEHLDFEDLKRELKDGTMQMDMESIEKLSDGYEKQIDELSTHYRQIQNENAANAEQLLKRNTELEKARRDLEEKQRLQQQLEGVRDIKVRLIKNAMRKVSFKNVDYENARKVIAIQSLFSPTLNKMVQRFIDVEGPYLRDAYSRYRTDADYRQKLQIIADNGGRKAREIIKLFAKPFDRWTEDEKQLAAKSLPRTDWIDKLNLKQLDEDRSGSIQLDMQSEEVQGLIKDSVSPELYALLTRKDLKLWTLEEMESLTGRINELYTEGRDTLRQKEEAKYQQAEELRARIQGALRSNGIVINDSDTPEEKERKRKLIERFKAKELPKILGTSGAIKGTLEASEKERGYLTRILHGYGDRNVRRIARLLDNGRDGVNTTLLYYMEDECFNGEQRSINSRSEKIEKAMKSTGVTFDDIFKKHTVDFGDEQHEFTADELLYFAAAAEDENSKMAVSCGNMYPESVKAAYRGSEKLQSEYKDMAQARFDIVLKAAEGLPENLRAFAKSIQDDYAEQYERMNKASIDEFNQPVWRVKNYVPLNRLESNGDTNMNRVKEDMLGTSQGTGAQGGYVGKGMTYKRIEISPANQRPVVAGLYSTWADGMKRTEHFINYSAYVRELNRVYNSRDSGTLRQYMDNRYGKEMHSYIEDYIKELANPTPDQAKSDLDRMIRALRGKTAPAYLAWKTSGVVKQLCTSPWPYMQYVSPLKYAAAALDMARSGGRLATAIRSKSAFMNTRTYDPIVDLVNEQRQKASNKAAYRLSQFEAVGMKGLEWADWACVAPGWLAVYRDECARLSSEESQSRLVESRRVELKSYEDVKGLDWIDGQAEQARLSPDQIEEQAVRKADDVTRMCQPSSRFADLAPMFKTRGKGSEAAQVLLQFTTSMNVIWQNMRYDLPNAVRMGQMRQAVGCVAGYVCAGIAMGLVTEGLGGDDGDDDKDKWLRTLYYGMSQFTGSVPVLGSALTDVTEGVVTGRWPYMGSQSMFPITTKTMSGIKSVGRGDWAKAAESFGYALGVGAGLPVSGAKEILAVAGVGDKDSAPGFKPQALLGRR